jgi:hypothetical protein
MGCNCGCNDSGMPIGPRGLQGLPGAPGQNGINGVDGVDGADGVDGLDGRDGVVVFDSLNYDDATRLVNSNGNFNVGIDVNDAIANGVFSAGGDMLEFTAVMKVYDVQNPFLFGIQANSTVSASGASLLGAAVSQGVWKESGDGYGAIHIKGVITYIDNTNLRCSCEFFSASANNQVSGLNIHSLGGEVYLSSTESDISVPSIASGIKIFPVIGVPANEAGLTHFSIWSAKKV